MKKIAKIWHYFVCAKLQPTTHVSAVMKSRAALVYAIMEGMKIDVGLVIQHSIIHGFEHDIQGFPHPLQNCARMLGLSGIKKRKFVHLKVSLMILWW